MSDVLMDQVKQGLSIEKGKVKVIANLGCQHFMCVSSINPMENIPGRTGRERRLLNVNSTFKNLCCVRTTETSTTQGQWLWVVKGNMIDEIEDMSEGVGLREEHELFIHCNQRESRENREIGTDVGSLVVNTKRIFYWLLPFHSEIKSKWLAHTYA